jgi:hypothetical protein
MRRLQAERTGDDGERRCPREHAPRRPDQGVDETARQ